MPRREPDRVGRKLEAAKLAIDGEMPSEGEAKTIRELVNHYEPKLLSSGKVPSLAEIERLWITRRLEQLESFERANALTREHG